MPCGQLLFNELWSSGTPGSPKVFDNKIHPNNSSAHIHLINRNFSQLFLVQEQNYFFFLVVKLHEVGFHPLPVLDKETLSKIHNMVSVALVCFHGGEAFCILSKRVAWETINVHVWSKNISNWRCMYVSESFFPVSEGRLPAKKEKK